MVARCTIYIQDDIPKNIVGEMVQYGKERLEAAGYVPYIYIANNIWEGS